VAAGGVGLGHGWAMRTPIGGAGTPRGDESPRKQAKAQFGRTGYAPQLSATKVDILAIQT